MQLSIVHNHTYKQYTFIGKLSDVINFIIVIFTNNL